LITCMPLYILPKIACFPSKCYNKILNNENIARSSGSAYLAGRQSDEKLTSISVWPGIGH
jgi:hypothetical protein